MNGTEAAAQLATILATAGATIAGLVQVAKTFLPDAWANGRAPMLLAAALSLLATIGAALQAGLPFSGPAAFTSYQALGASFLLVYSAAIATHQTVGKVARVVRGTTDPTGPDDAP